MGNILLNVIDERWPDRHRTILFEPGTFRVCDGGKSVTYCFSSGGVSGCGIVDSARYASMSEQEFVLTSVAEIPVSAAERAEFAERWKKDGLDSLDIG